MRLLKPAISAFVVIALVAAVTAALILAKYLATRPQHLIFYYLLPTALVAALLGTRLAMLCAVTAAASAAFFLYDPIYSFRVASPVEGGELACFIGLALIGAKCTADLLRPCNGFVRQNPTLERPALTDQNCDAS